MIPLAALGVFGDAIDLIFHSKESAAGGTTIGGQEFLDYTWDQLKLTIVAVGIGIAVAVPLGMWLGHIRKGSAIAINVSNIGRAVPTIALLGFFAAYLGLGFRNVAFALTLLAIPPILTNTFVGIYQVDRDTVDAARGMGMSGFQLLRKVELPLALPTVFGGIRTSAVNVVATATIAPFAGADSLGFPIINEQIYGQAGQLAAAILVAALAITIDALFGGLQRLVTPKGLKLDRGEPRFARVLRRREEAPT